MLSEKQDQNQTGFVAKVRSLKNDKIYSMKKNYIKNYNKQQIIYVFDKLKSLNHPHIIKYYNYFEENNCFYLIMEYMNNSDILGYIQGYQILNKQIPENEIWNILLQCLSALNYLEALNLENIGIKLTNIFMNDLLNTKISVFRDFDFNGDQTNSFENIKYLGKFFYAMVFSQFHTVEDLNNKTFIDNLNTQFSENNNYSQELIEILHKMVTPSDNINTFYEEVKNKYDKKFAKNTSIKAIISCLSSFEKLYSVINQKKNIIEKDKEKYYISSWYLKAIDALKGINESNLQIFIDKFKRSLASSITKIDGNKEIDPL